ncbi:hypothetical protein OR571_02305 [Psychrobacillus sp. NEAU-3TGS]|uniref:hypothetical protein n=1 Tax=Psychrobacillus sp. NEAU-3TGS TaxID=2995412 RepID=UPI002498B3A3|nr:hypothetical protein [Psychrobacillus sp. NEAU-3TGS]MDI2585993.1 hypothetical protein [Psychrobacillus sp. NEAU-3TGS]
MKNTKLRMVWILNNIFCYLMFIGFSIFVVINKEDFQLIDRWSIWVIGMLLLLMFSMFGTYRICGWIKEGKL